MFLDHVNLRCRDPERMVEFIEGLGCAHKGQRPDFDSHGYWLYDESERAVIHVSTATEAADSSPSSLDVGVVDHIAFRVSEPTDSLKARLISRKVDFTQRVNTLAGVTQLLVEAPEGLTIELQIPISE